MSRMVDALKVLEERRQAAPAAASRAPVAPSRIVVAPPRQSIAPVRPELAPPSMDAVSVRPIGDAAPVHAGREVDYGLTAATGADHEAAEGAGTDPLITARAMAERCSLPAATDLAGHYLRMAERIGDQLSTNYCNVLLFASLDYAVEPCFSITQVAQAFALRSPGDVLLVDGDLRRGRLSKIVWPEGTGVIEVMLGTASWPDAIHPTNISGIDFVASGHSQVPTFERPDFGWGVAAPLSRSYADRAGARPRSLRPIGWPLAAMRCIWCSRVPTPSVRRPAWPSTACGPAAPTSWARSWRTIEPSGRCA